MDVLTYVLDANVIGDVMRRLPNVVRSYTSALTNEHVLLLCPSVHYEITRGFLKSGASAQFQRYQTEFVPIMRWIPFERLDWEMAAQLWSDARSRGRQLSDMDLLLAAAAIRLDAIVVTADDDFDALPIRRENWRLP